MPSIAPKPALPPLLEENFDEKGSHTGTECGAFEPSAAMHIDAADVGYGGTLYFERFEAGRNGLYCDQNVWTWRDRAKSITLRELKAIRMLLSRQLGDKVRKKAVTKLLLHVDNQVVVHVCNSYVSPSRALMRELRKLKLVLDRSGIVIKAEWLPSVMNRYADSLSRRFPRGDLQIRRSLRRSVAAGMQAPLDAFRILPTGEHPVYLRKLMMDELDAKWDDGEMRMLCPPVDLLLPTVIKLHHTRAPAMFLMLDLPKKPWHQAAIRPASKVTRLPHPPEQVWTGTRRINPSCRLLLLECNI